MGWSYRICKRYTETPERKKICKHKRTEHGHGASGCYVDTGRMQKNYFYAIVEYYPADWGSKVLKKVPGKKTKETRRKLKGGWTMDNIAPIGDTPKEVIESLRMMLADAKRYPVINDTKKPWQNHWFKQSSSK